MFELVELFIKLVVAIVVGVIWMSAIAVKALWWLFVTLPSEIIAERRARQLR